ncbi:MAG: endonuclease/exonuclease/phosphatase family protein [Clostridia bacterium]|nr:endonuclease/exonuclease/phosphatase family protein [Clostridia bacterium]
MRRLCLILLVLCTLLISCQTGDSPVTDCGTATVTGSENETETTTAAPPKKSITFNVMSFNVYYNEAVKHPNNNSEYPIDTTVKVRGPKLKALLEGEKIDIFGVQEFSEAWRNWMKKNPLGGYAYVGGYTESTGESGYVFYREDKFSVAEYGVFWLSEGAPTTPANSWHGDHDRSCTWAIMQSKENGKYFLFMDTHLDNAGVAARNRGSRLIVEQIALLQTKVKDQYGVADCPVILVGDMNSLPESLVYQTFTEVLRDARTVSLGDSVDAKYSTSPGMRYYRDGEDFLANGHLIDYIFVSKSITVKKYSMIHTSSNRCPYGEYISDHNAIIARITL